MYKFGVAQFQRPPPVTETVTGGGRAPGPSWKDEFCIQEVAGSSRGEKQKVAPPQVRTGLPVRGHIRTNRIEVNLRMRPGFRSRLPPSDRRRGLAGELLPFFSPRMS